MHQTPECASHPASPELIYPAKPLICFGVVATEMAPEILVLLVGVKARVGVVKGGEVNLYLTHQSTHSDVNQHVTEPWCTKHNEMEGIESEKLVLLWAFCV